MAETPATMPVVDGAIVGGHCDCEVVVPDTPKRHEIENGKAAKRHGTKASGTGRGPSRTSFRLEGVQLATKLNKTPQTVDPLATHSPTLTACLTVDPDRQSCCDRLRLEREPSRLTTWEFLDHVKKLSDETCRRSTPLCRHRIHHRCHSSQIRSHCTRARRRQRAPSLPA